MRMERGEGGRDPETGGGRDGRQWERHGASRRRAEGGFMGGGEQVELEEDWLWGEQRAVGLIAQKRAAEQRRGDDSTSSWARTGGRS